MATARKKKKAKKRIPDDVFLLSQARKYGTMAVRALKRGDETAALAYTLNSNVFLSLLNEYIMQGRIPKPNWYRFQVKRLIIKLSRLVESVPEEKTQH